VSTATAPVTGARKKGSILTQERRAIRVGETEEAFEVASSALTVVAIVCIWMVLQLLVLGGLSELRSQHLLYDQYRSELAAATAPTGALDYKGVTVERGAPVALLAIPALDSEQVVVQGSTSRDLMAGPGHLPSTVLPGQQGTSVVMGRASTYGAPFRNIANLKPGDPIVVQNAEAKVTYRVEDVRRAGDPVPSTLTGTQARLTLVSAYGSGALSALRPRDAIFVDAIADKGTGAGYVAGASTADAVMARDTSVLPLLTLYLALLIALVLGVTVARRHVRTSLVWLVAAPVAIALAWVTTDQVVALLPNLM
jgi:sortase A